MTSILDMDSFEQGQGPSQYFESGLAASSEVFEKCFGKSSLVNVRNAKFVQAQVQCKKTFSNKKYD